MAKVVSHDSVKNFTIIRRDVVTMLKADTRLDRNARLVFLALAVENHGMEYTNIDYASMEDTWGIKKDMFNESLALLVKTSWIVYDTYRDNRTKNKHVAKYIGLKDGCPIPLGHRLMQSDAQIQPDILIYRSERETPEEVEAISAIPVGNSELVLGFAESPAEIPNVDSAIPNRDSAIPNRVSAIPNPDSVIPKLDSAMSHENSGIPKLIRKEDKRIDKKREESPLSISLFPPDKKEVTVEDVEALLRKLLRGTKVESQVMDERDAPNLNSLLVASEGNLDLLTDAVNKANVLKHEYLSTCFPRINDGLKKVKINATKSVREEFVMAMRKIDPHQFDYEGITGRPKPDDWTDEHSQCYLMMAKAKHPKHRLLHGSIISSYGAYNLQGVLNEYIK